MTKPIKPSDIIRSGLADLSRELVEARANAALYEQLRNSAKDVTKLQALCNEQTEALSKALSEEAKEEREALAATVQNIRIAVDFPNTWHDKRDLLGARIVLHCDQMKWDIDQRESLWTSVAYEGLEDLPPSVHAALMQDAGKLLPSIIADLAPGDPETAINRYHLAKSRGYVAG